MTARCWRATPSPAAERSRRFQKPTHKREVSHVQTRLRKGCTQPGPDGSAGAGGDRTTVGVARTRAPEYPADDRAARAAGRDHRNPGGDVHLRSPVAAVRLLPDDGASRLRRANVQRALRSRPADLLGRAGKAAAHLTGA